MAEQGKTEDATPVHGEGTDVSRSTIDVGDRLEISQVTILREKVLESLGGSCATVHVNLANVQYLDAAGVQLLWALKQEASGRGKRVDYDGISDAARTAALLLGLADQLV